MIKELLTKAVDENDLKSAEEIAKRCSESENDLAELIALLKNHSTVSSRDYLLDAYSKGFDNIIQILMAIPGLDVFESKDIKEAFDKDNDEYTLLIRAATDGRLKVVEALLKNKNMTKDYINASFKEYSALMMASIYGREEIVKLLLEHPAIEVAKETSWGKNALDFAVKNKKTGVVQLFESMGFQKRIPIDQEVLAEQCLKYLKKVKAHYDPESKDVKDDKDNKDAESRHAELKIAADKKRSVKYDPEDLAELRYQFGKGHCSGLSALWLESKEKKEGSIFFGNQSLISSWDPDTEPLFDENGSATDITKTFEQFISNARWTQGKSSMLVHRGKRRYLRETDFPEMFDVIRHSKLDPNLKVDFNFGFNITSSELTTLLDNVVIENKKIWLGGEDHAVAVFKQNGVYYAYDSNPPAGEFPFTTLADLQNFLEHRLFKSFNYPTDMMSIYLCAFDSVNKLESEEEPSAYPYKMNETELMESFLKGNPDVQRKTFSGNTALHIATEVGLEEPVRLLLKQKDIDINAKNDKGSSPLQEAASCGHLEIVKSLLSRTDVNVKGIWDALILASANGYYPIVKLLKNALSKREKKFSDLGFSVDDPAVSIFLRVCEGDVTAVEDCARLGVDVNKRDPSGNTLLMWAVYFCHDKVVRALLNKFPTIDLSLRNSKNKNVFMLAANVMNDRSSTIKEVLRDRKVEEEVAWEALIVAASKNKRNILHAIADHAKINLKDPWTRMMIETVRKRGSLIFYTMYKDDPDNKTLFNKQDPLGYTIAMRAIENQNYDVLDALIKFSLIDCTIKNKDGKTVLNLAEDKNDQIAIEILKKITSNTNLNQSLGLGLETKTLEGEVAKTKGKDKDGDENEDKNKVLEVDLSSPEPRESEHSRMLAKKMIYSDMGQGTSTPALSSISQVAESELSKKPTSKT